MREGRFQLALQRASLRSVQLAFVKVHEAQVRRKFDRLRLFAHQPRMQEMPSESFPLASTVGPADAAIQAALNRHEK